MKVKQLWLLLYSY